MQNDNNEHHYRSSRYKSIGGYNVMEDNAVYEKNILKLLKEIHQHEKILEEKKKAKKIKNKEALSQSQYPKIQLTPLNNQTIQYILSCKLRTPNMLTILNAFLSTMKFLSVSADNEDKEKLLYSLSFCLKMDKKANGSIIFRYGNKGTRFYIVLGGEVSVLILREKVVELNSLNYLKYLLYLKIIKEDELAKKVIEANHKLSFNITEKYLDLYYEDILSFINRYYIVVPVNNESENPENIETKNSINNKKIFKKENNNNDEDYPKGLYNCKNKLDFKNINNTDFNNDIERKPTGNETMGSSVIKKIKTKNNIPFNNEEKKENKNSESDNENSEISNKSFLEKNKKKN